MKKCKCNSIPVQEGKMKNCDFPSYFNELKKKSRARERKPRTHMDSDLESSLDLLPPPPPPLLQSKEEDDDDGTTLLHPRARSTSESTHSTRPPQKLTEGRNAHPQSQSTVMRSMSPTPTLTKREDGTASYVYGKNIASDLFRVTAQFHNIFALIKKETVAPNVLIVGTTGSGKSTLINSVFGEKVAQEGTGKPVTEHFARYQIDDLPVVIYDSKGLEHGNTAEFVESTKRFFAETQGDVRNMIHVVWYVVNGASSRVQPYEEEICKLLFDEIPVIFIINKGDISSDADRAIIRETLKSFKLRNCCGIFDAVSGDRDPLLKIERCPECGSDDIEIRKSKQIVCCESCGKTSSMKVSRKDIITSTLNILPKITRDAFIFAQAYSCSHKDERAKEVIREHVREFSGTCLGGNLSRVFTKTLVRLAILWKIQHYGIAVSKEIASRMLQRAYSVSGDVGRFLRKIAFGVAENANSTTAIAVIWNRCLRSIFIKIFMTCSKGEDHVNPEEYIGIVESAFEDLNEDEHKATLAYLNEEGLEALLQREMPSNDPEIPSIPLPFVIYPSKDSKHLLMGSPIQIPVVAPLATTIISSVTASPYLSPLPSASASPSLNSSSTPFTTSAKEATQEATTCVKLLNCPELQGSQERLNAGYANGGKDNNPKLNDLLPDSENIIKSTAKVLQRSQSSSSSGIPSKAESPAPLSHQSPALQIQPVVPTDTALHIMDDEMKDFSEEITKEAEKEEDELREALHYPSRSKSFTNILIPPLSSLPPSTSTNETTK